MVRTYKRKLILTKAQTERVEQWMGVCRMVYNMGLEIQNASYKAFGKNLHVYDLETQIKTIRVDYDWIRDVPFQCLELTLFRLNESYNNFFRTYKNGGGYPKFASKRTFRSIPFKQQQGVIRVIGNTVNLPKLGKVKMFKDSDVAGAIKRAQIVKEPIGYFICIQCDNVPQKFISENQTIGLDMGLSHFCIDSNGNFIANPKHFKKYERQLRIENRSLARKKEGSSSWKKQCKRLSLLHHKIKNVRKDFLHKQSTIIAKGYSGVYMENLNVRGMVRNGGLSKHILDAGWGMFRTMLEYKTTVIRVNPKHTSQTCSQCGLVDSGSRQSQAEFICTGCGHSENADVNAAKNILSKGIAISRQRDSLECALTLESQKAICQPAKEEKQDQQ